jgi:hypothetical protein
LIPRAIAGGLRFRTLAAGERHTCGIVIFDPEVVVCWGYNLYGQLGDGTVKSRSFPRAVLGQL